MAKMTSRTSRTRITFDGQKLEAREWTLGIDTQYIDLTSWTGDTDSYFGDKEVMGTFSGSMDSDFELPDGPTEIVLYGPAKLPWWKRLGYRIAGRLFDTPWPEQAYASGLAYTEFEIKARPEGGTTISGRFESTGEWTIQP